MAKCSGQNIKQQSGWRSEDSIFIKIHKHVTNTQTSVYVIQGPIKGFVDVSNRKQHGVVGGNVLNISNFKDSGVRELVKVSHPVCRHTHCYQPTQPRVFYGDTVCVVLHVSRR